MDTHSADLFRLEFLKKAALEILESNEFNNARTTEAQSLRDLLTNHVLLKVPSTVPSATLPTSGDVIELLKKQLLEDSALLRRISRVEGFAGVDYKAVIQSGDECVFDDHCDQI